MKQFVLNKLGKVSQAVSEVVERTELTKISCAELKFRLPWNLLFGDIARNNVTVAGDALHPMTPDIGQGGCSSLEDSVMLARCLGEALLTESRPNVEDEEEFERLNKALEKYAKERRWRSFSLISTAYMVGLLQQSDGRLMSFLKRKWLSKYTSSAFVRMADFDCGKLVS